MHSVNRIFYRADTSGDPVVTLEVGIDLVYNQSVDIIFGPTDAQGSHNRYYFN